MKAVGILGSPRIGGTSERIARSFLESAEKLGADVEVFSLNRLDFRGCQGCEACHFITDHCVLKDELKEVLDSLHEAEIAVFATPVYMGDVTGQFKTFLDRTWSLVDVDYSRPEPFETRLSTGKTAVFIMTQADTEAAHGDIVDRIRSILEMLGYNLEIIRSVGLMSGAVDGDVSEAQTQATAIAEQLMS